MATQNRRGYGNPGGSADLGSGIRTTTGGSYRNPRLGIEDTTAFGRGFASTFRMPEIEQKEKDQLAWKNLNVFGDEMDEFTGGFTLNSEFLQILNNTFKEGELTEYQKIFENGDQTTRDKLQAHVTGYHDDFKKFQNYGAKYADAQVYDPNVSERRLPGTESGKYSELTYADITEDSHKNPKDWRTFSVVNKNGIVHRGLEKKSTGQRFSMTAMTEERLSKDFHVRADIAGDVQISILKDGTAQGYKAVKPTYNEDKTSVTINLPDGSTVETDKNSKKYIRQDWYNDTDNFATIFAGQKYGSKYDATYKSAWYQLGQKFENGSFIPSDNLMTHLKSEYGINNISELSGIDITNEDRIRLLQDEAKEEFKILNGSVGYDRDGRKTIPDPNNPENQIDNPNYGRALDRRVVQYNTDNIRKPRTDDDSDSGPGGAWSSGSSISDIRQNLFTQDITTWKDKSPTGKHQGKMVLLDNNTMSSLQREITSRFGQGNFIFKRDRLEDMLIKSELSENEDFEDYESIDDLSNKEKTALDLRIKKQIDSYSSQYPEGQIFTYINGKVDVDTILQDGMMYNKDIKDFIKSFGSVSERKDIEKGWAGSDLQKEDMKVRNAVKTGDMTGLTDWEKKQAEFIIARKK